MTQLKNVVLWNDEWIGGKLGILTNPVQVTFWVNIQNITYFYQNFLLHAEKLSTGSTTPRYTI